MPSFGMPHTLKALLGRLGEDDGQALVEYALLISLVAIVCVAGVGTFGLQVAGMYSHVVNLIP
jgi:Flp pilus assembly pilin Flp